MEDSHPSISIPTQKPFLAVGETFHDYRILKNIGSGGFGEVYLVQRENSEQPFAMKVVQIKGGELSKEVIREISLLYDVDHENVVRLITVFVEGQRLCFVMERAKCDLQSETFPIQNFETIRKWMYQILSAVAHLHEVGILHRDLKPSNILMTEEGSQLKITDFGLSRGHIYPGAQITPLLATAEFSAPEILLGSRNYDAAIDMWSIGCIFAIMIQGENPFSNHDSLVAEMFRTHHKSSGLKMSTIVLKNIFRMLGTPDETSWPGVTELPNYPTGEEIHQMAEFTISSDIEPEGKDLLKRLFQVNPKDRITAKEALRHPFFKCLLATTD